MKELKIRVVPNSSRNELVGDKLYLKAVPEKGKANQAIVKFFKKNFNQKVRIKAGLKSRNKILEIF